MSLVRAQSARNHVRAFHRSRQLSKVPSCRGDGMGKRVIICERFGIDPQPRRINGLIHYLFTIGASDENRHHWLGQRRRRVRQKLGKKGHSAVFGVCDKTDEKLRSLLKDAGPNARAGDVQEAAAFGEVVVFATPWPAAQDAIRSAGDLKGKIVFDCTNPLKPDLSGLQIGHTHMRRRAVLLR